MARKKQIRTGAKKSTGRISSKKVTIDGYKFASKLESEYYLLLKDKKEKGLIKDFKMQETFLLQEKYIVIDGQVIKESNKDFSKLKKKYGANTVRSIKYIADYVVTNNDNSIDVIDTKGRSTEVFEIKKKMFMYIYPNYNFKVLCLHDGQWVDYYYAQKLLKEKRANKHRLNKKDGE